MNEATGSATPSAETCGIVKFNGPLCQFPVNRAFQIIQCWISQLLLYSDFGYNSTSWRRNKISGMVKTKMLAHI
jgi:hypothetical protein